MVAAGYGRANAPIAMETHPKQPIPVSIIAPSEAFRIALAHMITQEDGLLVLSKSIRPMPEALHASCQPRVVLIGIPRLVDTPLAWVCAREAVQLWPTVRTIVIGGEPATASWDLLYQALITGVAAWISYPSSPAYLGQLMRTVATGSYPLDELLIAEPLLMKHIAHSLRTTPMEPSTQHEFLHLSAYELAVLDGIARGLSHKQIAGAMGIKAQTAKNHARSLYSKLGVSNRTQAMLTAVARGGIAI